MRKFRSYHGLVVGLIATTERIVFQHRQGLYDTVWYSYPLRSLISTANPISTLVRGIKSVVDEMASIFILSGLQSRIVM